MKNKQITILMSVIMFTALLSNVNAEGNSHIVHSEQVIVDNSVNFTFVLNESVAMDFNVTVNGTNIVSILHANESTYHVFSINNITENQTMVCQANILEAGTYDILETFNSTINFTIANTNINENENNNNNTNDNDLNQTQDQEQEQSQEQTVVVNYVRNGEDHEHIFAIFEQDWFWILFWSLVGMVIFVTLFTQTKDYILYVKPRRKRSRRDNLEW